MTRLALFESPSLQWTSTFMLQVSAYLMNSIAGMKQGAISLFYSWHMRVMCLFMSSSSSIRLFSFDLRCYLSVIIDRTALILNLDTYDYVRAATLPRNRLPSSWGTFGSELISFMFLFTMQSQGFIGGFYFYCYLFSIYLKYDNRISKYFYMKVTKRIPELLTIFHFNDIYNIQPHSEEPKGGAAYFNSLLQREKQKYRQVLTLFSGDAFSPSLISNAFQGQNMIQPLNSFGIDLACFGNHDLDCEVSRVVDRTKRTNFPWLLSNIYDRRTSRRLAQGLQSFILHKNGLKIGVFSLAEKQWIDTLYPYYKDICEYVPFIDFAEKMVPRLRGQQKCDMVIALTHMMKSNDIKLAKSVKGIDLILGGHDHLVTHEKYNDSVMVKSGTDFRNFSIIKVNKNEGKRQVQSQLPSTNTFLSTSRWNFELQLKEVNHQRQAITPDPQLDKYVHYIYRQFKEKQEKVACYTASNLDLRFSTIRKEQSPFLQFLVSIYKNQTGADLAMCNSGSFRMDTIIKQGPITFGIIQDIIPDKIIVKAVPGTILVEALQNCVSMYPNLAGRYSAFSGIEFTWDASRQPGSRILVDSITIQETKIELNKIYKVAIHSFTGKGGDGFDCFKQCQTVEGKGDRSNIKLVLDLLHINHFLLDTFLPQYPGRCSIIEKDGRKYVELSLPEPKNVHMITSTGQIYEAQ